MTAQQFAYWLQGFVELQETTVPSKQQWNMIKEHLQLVFTKKTYDREFKPFIVPDKFTHDNTIIC